MILGDPELVRQLDVIARPGGVAYGLSDVHLAPETCSVAYRAGEVAGFTMGVRLNDAGGVPFAFLRLGVGERHRRHGVGSALLARAVARLEASTPLREILIGAWIPAEAAERFVEHHGLVYSRTYWLMERPKGGMADAVWPDGIVMRTYDGSRRAIEDLTEIANDSFSEHDHFAPGTVEEALSLTQTDVFRADGLALAYRGKDCLGFCRCTIYPGRGEISAIGTSKRARGIGLGRALLRWGVGWLEANDSPRVTLMVDGENESALRLYRQEAFEVVATRKRWSKRGRLWS